MKQDTCSLGLRIISATPSVLLGLALFGLALPVWAAPKESARNGPVEAQRPASTAKKAPPSLPALPEGVAELKFKDFFVQPVGNRGLELTEKMRNLDGQRVRILGFMVQQDTNPPGMFLLAPIPLQLHEHEDHCSIDDLPPNLLHVIVPSQPQKAFSHSPGLLLLTGTLNVGNRSESGGRVSIARLLLDPPEPKSSRFVRGEKGAQRLRERL